jgi:cell wall-associated NlpC family hydrolase
MAASENYPTRLIACPVVPMFRAPDSNSEQVSQALLGTAVSELGGHGNWRFVTTPDNYPGWVETAALRDHPISWGSPFVEVKDLWINLRAEPSYAAVIHATIGVRLPLRGRSVGWVGLLVPGGETLWTEAHRVRIVRERASRVPSPAAVVRTARRFLGVPYLWGGCSPLGLDCSGFVQLVLRLHGMEVSRDAHLQAVQGESVGDPEAADLVFFGPPDRPDAVTHVGMMLDESRCIHASGGNCVRVDRLRDLARRLEYRGARRFIPRR